MGGSTQSRIHTVTIYKDCNLRFQILIQDNWTFSDLFKELSNIRDMGGLDYNLFGFQNNDGVYFLMKDKVWNLTEKEEELHLFSAPDPGKIDYIKNSKR